MSKYAKVYYDPSNPGGFGGVDKLWKEVGGSRKAVEEWLKTQDTYTLHRPAQKRLKRNRIQVAGLDDQWEADLVDVHGIAKYNNNFTFLLTCIDTLSKYAFVHPLKDKAGGSIVKAFQKIFKVRKPRKLRTDSGKEFLNRPFQQFLKANDVIFFTSNNDPKAAVVERFNRTLRTKMWRYFTATRQERYTDVLQHLVDSYNATVHSTTGYAPADVNVMNGETVWRKMHKFPLKRKQPMYQPGDLVRISKVKKTFEKGYRPNWTREVFKIKRVYKRALPEYTIQDLTGEDILGKFLERELQAVRPTQTTYKVKRIVRTKGRGAAKQHLISWEGYPDKFQTWIPSKDLKQYV